MQQEAVNKEQKKRFKERYNVEKRKKFCNDAKTKY